MQQRRLMRITKFCLRYWLVFLIVFDLLWVILEYSPTTHAWARRFIVEPLLSCVRFLNVLYWNPMHWAVAFGVLALLLLMVRHVPMLWRTVVEEWNRSSRLSRKRVRPVRPRSSRHHDHALDAATKSILDMRRDRRR